MALGHFLESNRDNVEAAVRCSGMDARVVGDGTSGYVTVTLDTPLTVEQTRLFWQRYFELEEDSVLDEIAAAQDFIDNV